MKSPAVSSGWLRIRPMRRHSCGVWVRAARAAGSNSEEKRYLMPIGNAHDGGRDGDEAPCGDVIREIPRADHKDHKDITGGLAAAW